MNTILKKRAEIVRKVRRFFDERDFVEVETAVRIAAPAPEVYIDCPLAPLPDGEAAYLRASPELQMKKLLAAGMDKIYEIGPCFREEERGIRHNSEFTMLEWYRKGATYKDIAGDLSELFQTLLPKSAMPKTEFPILRVREAYIKYAGWDPWTQWDSDRFDYDMTTKIEPALKALGGGIFLADYPVDAASLSKVSEDASGAKYAERWEFYFDGMELANCFTELCDCEEQRVRFERAKAMRRELGEADYPIDDEFLALLPTIGSASGVALGMDRLVMVLTGAKTIMEVRAPV